MIRFIKRNYGWLTLGLICSLGLALYYNILHSPFQFDDENFIVNNLSIRQLSNFKGLSSLANTRFITYLSFALNYHFHQLHVFGYHLFNLGIHLITAMLVWLLLRITLTTPLLYSQKISYYAKAVSFFAGIIFLVHPIQTEGVTYIYQRSSSLATLCYLASLILYVKYRLLNLSGKSLKYWILYYNSSLIIAALAMFTKETAFTLPFMIILYELCFFRKRSGAEWLRIILFLLTLAIIPITIMFNLNTANLAAVHQILEKNARSSSWNYLLTQFRVIVTYIRLAFLPLNQNLDYDYPLAKGLFALPVLSCILFLLAILISALRILHNYRLLSFGVFWFFLTLIPESSIIPIRDVIFEHRLYLPMIGYSVFLVSLIYYFFSFKKGKFAIILLTSIAVVYAVATYNRNQVWQDKLTL